MKPYRLLHLFRHIADKNPCPHCGSKIAPHEIVVDASTEQSAFLTMTCSHCKSSLQAHVLINTSPEGIAEVEAKQKEISSDEFEETHDFLVNFKGGIDDLFPGT